MGAPDFTYDFGPPRLCMLILIILFLYNELVYYLHTHLLLSDTMALVPSQHLKMQNHALEKIIASFSAIQQKDRVAR